MKIISGGQTGTDRAALDAAIYLDLPHGGWCPAGRRAEDGSIAPIYRLKETRTRDYTCRTEWNVRDADATLILHRGNLEGGTAYTIACAKRLYKPCLTINLERQPHIQEILDWLMENKVNTLNIAGPRESKKAGIYKNAYDFLVSLLGNISAATEFTEK